MSKVTLIDFLLYCIIIVFGRIMDFFGFESER